MSISNVTAPATELPRAAQQLLLQQAPAAPRYGSWTSGLMRATNRLAGRQLTIRLMPGMDETLRLLGDDMALLRGGVLTFGFDAIGDDLGRVIRVLEVWHGRLDDPPAVIKFPDTRGGELRRARLRRIAIEARTKGAPARDLEPLMAAGLLDEDVVDAAPLAAPTAADPTTTSGGDQ